MVQAVKTAFLGLGTLGSQLMEYMRERQPEIPERYGVRLEIGKVFVRNPAKKRSIDMSGLILCKNPYEVMEEADIVIECLGGDGEELTKELVLHGISNKKAVIMSSKKCLARYGREIIGAVSEHQTLFGYDAAVGGGIPISSILATMGKCEDIRRIYGICNATSNYILGQMQEGKAGYPQALEKAKEMGYAENDPSEDVDGYDALYKTVILAGFGMGRWISYQDLLPISIEKITPAEVAKADREGCVIKPVFYVEAIGGELLYFIGPAKVKKDTILALVNGSNNIIVLDGSESGERAFYGRGAGAKPTASAMFDDVIRILEAGYQPGWPVTPPRMKEFGLVRQGPERMDNVI